MASQKDTVPSFPKEIVCPGCQNIYEDPKVLPCLHSFCKKCLLDRNAHEVEHVLCPTCSMEFKLSDIASDFYTTSLVILHELTGDDALNVCTMCSPNNCSPNNSQEKSKFYCVDCCESLCEKCFQCHYRMKVTKEHKVIDLDEISPEHLFKVLHRPVKCPRHPKEHVTFLCKDCGVLICLLCDCFYDKHTLISTTDREIDAIINDLKTKLTKVGERIPQIHDSVHYTYKLIEELETNKLTMEETVKTSFDAIKTAIDNQEMKLLEELQKRVDIKRNFLNAESEKNMKVLENMRRNHDISEKMIVHGNTEELISIQKCLKQNLQEQLTREAQSIPAEFSQLGISIQRRNIDSIVDAIGKLQFTCSLSWYCAQKEKEETTGNSKRDDSVHLNIEEGNLVDEGPCVLPTHSETVKIKVEKISPIEENEARSLEEEGQSDGGELNACSGGFKNAGDVDMSETQGDSDSPVFHHKRKFSNCASNADDDEIPSSESEVFTEETSGKRQCLLGYPSPVFDRIQDCPSIDENTCNMLEASAMEELKLASSNKNKTFGDTTKQDQSYHNHTHNNCHSASTSSIDEFGMGKADGKTDSNKNSNRTPKKTHNIKSEWRRIKSVIEINEDSESDTEDEEDANRDQPVVIRKVKSEKVDYDDHADYVHHLFASETRILGCKKKSEKGFLNLPNGMSFDPTGNVVVAALNNNSIKIISLSNKYVRQFGYSGQDPGRLKSPSDVALGPANKYIVSDCENHRIQIFWSNGIFQKTFGAKGSGPGKFCFPLGIAMSNAKNQLIVADKDNHRIQVFDLDGNFKFMFGGEGDSDGKFRFPRFVAVAGNGDIFVTDSGNHRVQVFNYSGVFLYKIGTKGKSQGKFNNPTGIALSENGFLFVADYYTSRIQCFTDTGEFLFTFGKLGSGLCEFRNPEGLLLSQMGDLLVADSGRNRLHFIKDAVQKAEKIKLDIQ